ncbi:hypothetical protein [Pseudomonas sp. B21-048]|uniref:hypothetical protein n=1 Tax=Pseudomonas sp. B21-048 TaxID=2895490 RepID=UPI00215DDC6B|nr:hypothetical protein [Pseudomonas sp. B21-048]UVK98289.1 hypothetical protein LOY56_23790 [Pseudomonas sp. B21-048]
MLDSVVKERLVKIFRLNRGAHSTAASVAVKRLFSEVFKVFLNNFNHLRFRSLVSGRRILQRYSPLSTPLFPLSTEKIEPSKEPNNTALSTPSSFDELKRNHCRKLRNSLFTKEFSVSTAPEVGRIIGFQNLPSTPDLSFIQI